MKVKRHLERIDQKIDEYVELLDTGDLSDEKQEEVKDKIKKKKSNDQNTSRLQSK